MKKRGRYLRTVLALAVVAGLLLAALFVPDVVSGWYDSASLGQVQYQTMEYEPYEIVCYDSFEEKVGAIAAYAAEEKLYTLSLEEGEETLGESELLALVNEELSGLYDAGVLARKLSASELLSRTFLELYPSKERRDLYPQNVYLWQLVCATDDEARITLIMDSEYHKLYWFRLYDYLLPHKEIEVWYQEMSMQGAAFLSEAWAKYWGLADAAPLMPENDFSVSDAAGSQAYEFDQKGYWESVHYLRTSSRVAILFHSYVIFSAYEICWKQMSGLEFFRED